MFIAFQWTTEHAFRDDPMLKELPSLPPMHVVSILPSVTESFLGFGLEKASLLITCSTRGCRVRISRMSTVIHE
jgi:hypothetical protein